MVAARTAALLAPAVLWGLAASGQAQNEGDGGRRIEEIVVTAEKRESTVSDTSISITAFGEEMIADYGIQSPDELVNFIPATTRDPYDIRIRGVGRNFRALGGDPGVATYYNGIYSEDFGIAATENALYDIERVEVLRGPQGTLYGRNSIGGALNYITREPTFNWTGELRGQFGDLDTQEYYAILSGPIIDEVLAFRFNGSKRKRDGSKEGQFGSPDVDSINDQNASMAFLFQPSDRLRIKTRYNDRRSLRNIDRPVIINEGFGDFRGTRSTDKFAYGIVAVPEGTPGASRFTDPDTGAVAWGAPPRPGVDAAQSMPVHAFGGTPYLNGAGDLGKVKAEALTNGYNREEFDHQSVSFDAAYDFNDQFQIRYLFGYSNFEYTFDFDDDLSDGTLSQSTLTVLEDVYTYSHELQLLWDPNERLSLTAGVYNFYSNRLQDFTITNTAAQGRVTDPANYGFLDLPLPFLGGFSMLQLAGIGPAVGLNEVPIGTQLVGRWDGGDGSGDLYRHRNKSQTDQYAVFGQATYEFSDQWALTLGVRWAEDDKKVFENRGGYVEVDFLGAFAGLYPFLLPSPFLLAGQTNLSMTNILMGAAIPTGNPAQPILPTCAYSDPNCATPLRLSGVPLSWAGRAKDSNKWDAVTWRVNLDWTPNEDTLVYLSATTGYRAGGYGLGILDARIDEAGQIKPLGYDQEDVIAYELGYKGTLADGTLQLNASIYTYDYENYQDQIDVFDPLQQTFRDIPTNTGDARNTGFEVEITWLATEQLTINGNYSLTDTEYKSEFVIAEDDDPARPAPLFGLRLIDLNGNQLKRIPKHKGTVWANYEWLTDIGKFVASGALAYTGAYYTSPLERPLDKVPDRWRTDLSVAWMNQAETLQVRAFVDNVFDEGNLRGIGTGNHTNFYRMTGTYLYPRYWGVDIRWSFGN